MYKSVEYLVSFVFFAMTSSDCSFFSSMLERILITPTTLQLLQEPSLVHSTSVPLLNSMEYLSFSTLITVLRSFFHGLMDFFLHLSVTTRNTASPFSLLT